MEGKLRVNVTCTTADSGPLPFSVLMSEDETIADMVARLRKELQARQIPVQVFAGPVSTAMTSPARSATLKAGSNRPAPGMTAAASWPF